MIDDAPATKKDLADLGKDLRTDAQKNSADLEERLVSVMREIETKLLRGFFDYAESTDLRLRKLKADVSNVDAVTEQRVDRLEHRIRRIEHRLDYGDNPTAPPVPPSL
jgi:cob(I)alamin adenosyltransferase